jgi:uncharacterized protein
MIIRVSELPDEGLDLTNVHEFEHAYADPSWRLERIALRLERDGVDVVVHGEIAATVPQTCGRCLAGFPAAVRAFVDLRLAPRPTEHTVVELAADDLDVDFYAEDQLNLDALIETETTLALPMKPLCRDECRGLCAICGGDRNSQRCSCEAPPADPRLAVLKDWAPRSRP